MFLLLSLHNLPLSHLRDAKSLISFADIIYIPPFRQHPNVHNGYSLKKGILGLGFHLPPAAIRFILASVFDYLCHPRPCLGLSEFPPAFPEPGTKVKRLPAIQGGDV
jgi:hypothetical protein